MTLAALKRWRLLATLCYLALFSWMGLWLCRDGVPVWWVLALAWGPLWLPLYGILRGRIYTFAWCSFVIIPYFGHALMLAWITPEQRPAAIVEGFLALGSMLTVAYFTRFAARYRRHHGPSCHADLGLDE